MWRWLVRKWDRQSTASSNLAIHQKGVWRVRYLDGAWSTKMYKHEANSYCIMFGGKVHYCRYNNRPKEKIT